MARTFRAAAYYSSGAQIRHMQDRMGAIFNRKQEETMIREFSLPRQGLRLASALVACSAALLSPLASAQDNYPNKAIRFIVTVVPGGGADSLGRMVAGKMSDTLRQPVVVENITGASGLLAYQTLMKAPADAHTILIASSSSYNATNYSRKLGDPQKAMAPVVQLTSQPLVMMVNNSLPIRNMKELVAYGKKYPDGLNFASPGIGSSSHLIGEMINQKGGLKMVHIPYKGIGPGILDVISGRIQIAFGSPGSAGPHVRSGKVRAVAHSGGKRTGGMPDLPTMAEQGMDIDWSSWFGIFTTYGSPRPSILKLNAVINEAAASPEMLKMFAADGSDPAPGTPEQFGATVQNVLDTGLKLIKEMGLKLE